jgi:hypothetical protein
MAEFPRMHETKVGIPRINASLTMPAPICRLEGSRGMSVFRIQLADGEKTLKADLKAFDENGARSAAEKWFSGARWQIVGIRQLAD